MQHCVTKRLRRAAVRKTQSQQFQHQSGHKLASSMPGAAAKATPDAAPQDAAAVLGVVQRHVVQTSRATKQARATAQTLKTLPPRPGVEKELLVVGANPGTLDYLVYLVYLAYLDHLAYLD